MGVKKPFWKFCEPKKSYDAVIIGGGLHGMAAAYYLALDHGMSNIAVLEKNRFGFGGSSRNTEVIRANQRAPEILPLYVQSIKLWNELSAEVEWNFMVWMKGLIGLAHNAAGLNSMRMRHATQTNLGIENHILTPEELKKLIPALDISSRAAIPVVGGYYHPPGGSVRHDAAIWGFMKGLHQHGVHLCPGVEVTGINVKNGRVTGVNCKVDGNETTISTPLVHMALGGWSSEIAAMAGITLPVVTLPLQAMVTECVKPFLNHVVVSELYFCYCQQSIKGDLIMGAHLDPWQSYKSYNTYEFASEQAYFMLELFPDLAHLKLMRSWSGLCDMTVDGAPIMGKLPVEGLFIDAGWGYFGFKASTACGKNMAELMATGRTPEKIRFLGMDRFYEGRMVPEVYIARS
jgi:sarcosine oxidase subunit beta